VGQDPGAVPQARVQGTVPLSCTDPTQCQPGGPVETLACGQILQSATGVQTAPAGVTFTCGINKSVRRNLQQSTALNFLLTQANGNPNTLRNLISNPTTAAALNAALAQAGFKVTAQQILTQDLSPTSAPVASPSSSSPACFAGSEMVTMESGVSKPIRDVQVGDRIMSFDPVARATFFTDVVYLPHGANSFRTTFTQIRTRSGRDVKVTKNHVLPAGSCDGTVALSNVEAAAVVVGHCVLTTEGRDEIVEVVEVEAVGIYTAVPMAELIVVNGVVATPYGGVNTVMANVFYNLHRLAYCMSSKAIKELVSPDNFEQLWRTIHVLGTA